LPPGGFQKVHTSLHAQEAAPYEDAAAVQQSGNDVAEQEGEVSPGVAHIVGHVPAKSSSNAVAVAALGLTAQ